MNNWKFICSLVFFWSLCPSFTFAQINDSTVVTNKIKPKIVLLKPEKFKLNPFTQVESYPVSFYNLNFPNYDLLISRENTSDSISPANQYRSGFNNFSQYMDLYSNNLEVDTGKSVSKISLILGTKREQLLFIDHKQKIGKNFIVGLTYNSIVSEGFLFHQYGKMKAFESSLQFSKKIYALLFNYNYHKVEAEENGGIVSGQTSSGLSKSDYGLLKLNLADGSTKFKCHYVSLQQSINIFDNNPKQITDSINSSKVLLGFNSSYKVFGHSYEGTNDSAFYSNFYINADSTKDSSSYNDFKNNVFLNYLFISQSQLFSSSIFMGVSRSDIIEKQLNGQSKYFYLTPYATAKINWYSFQLLSNFQAVKSKSQKNSDHSFLFELSKSFNNGILNSIMINLQESAISSDAISRTYYSNHFQWLNNFKQEKVTSLNLNIKILDQHISAFVNHSTFENKIYYNYEALPSQLNNKVNQVKTGVVLSTRIKKFYFYSNMFYGNSNNTIIRIPDYTLYGRISYKDYFFKKALLAELGFSGIYMSAYKANAYMPATGQYYLQDEKMVGGTPTIHLFANLEIGSAVIFLKIENISNNLFSGENELVPNYPVPPRTFKLGVRWLLRN